MSWGLDRRSFHQEFVEFLSALRNGTFLTLAMQKTSWIPKSSETSVSDSRQESTILEVSDQRISVKFSVLGNHHTMNGVVFVGSRHKKEYISDYVLATFQRMLK